MPTPENQKKIEYLSRYRKLGKRIEQLSTERAMWLSRACKTTQTISDMPKAKNGAQGDSGEVAQYIEIGEEITRELRNLHRLRREIRAVITTLEDDILQTLMLYRYIDGMTFEEIAVKMNYSYVHVCRLHGQALSKIML
jgi:DNA-directed RNA polymerase specialized sigma subunit